MGGFKGVELPGFSAAGCCAWFRFDSPPQGLPGLPGLPGLTEATKAADKPHDPQQRHPLLTKMGPPGGSTRQQHLQRGHVFGMKPPMRLGIWSFWNIDLGNS